MPIPKPSEIFAATKASNTETPEPKKAVANKKPFVRKEHLTDRPLKNNPQLAALKASLDNRHK